jgi:hypothetical protein
VYLLILGCNVWNVILLSVAAWLGFQGSRWHVTLSLFAAIFSALVHGGGVALFLGGGKLVKEHVGRFDLPERVLDRYNEVYRAFVPKAILGGWSMPLVGVIGGLAGNGYLPRWTHWSLSLLALGYQYWLIPHEYRWLKRFHSVVREVDALLPETEALKDVEPHPKYTPDEVVMDARGRARALLYIGLTIPFTYLGYTYIAGFDVEWLAVPAAAATAACLGGSYHYYKVARRSSG